jgi:hypothetical protein
MLYLGALVGNKPVTLRFEPVHKPVMLTADKILTKQHVYLARILGKNPYLHSGAEGSRISSSE